MDKTRNGKLFMHDTEIEGKRENHLFWEMKLKHRI